MARREQKAAATWLRLTEEIHRLLKERAELTSEMPPGRTVTGGPHDVYKQPGRFETSYSVKLLKQHVSAATLAKCRMNRRKAATCRKVPRMKSPRTVEGVNRL